MSQGAIYDKLECMQETAFAEWVAGQFSVLA